MQSIDRRTNSRTKWIVAAGVAATLAGRELLLRAREEDLHGQVALITGGTSGLGFLLAREFAHEGCKIVICARDEADLESARDELAREGAEVLALPCDVANRAQVDDMIRRATDHFGRIDILVNNAGIIQVAPVESLALQDFEDAMAIMFWGTVYATLSVLPQMRARRSGRIVNITSIGGKVSVPHLVPYSSAKFAAVGFSEGLRPELGKHGVSITTIVPGLMRTGSFLNALFKGRKDREFVWFSLGSSLPLISMDAERAATQIVQATKRREAERILSLPANVIAKTNGLLPGLTQSVLRATERLILPDANGGTGTASLGREVQTELASDALESATALGQQAAERFQPDDHVPPASGASPQ